MARWRLTTPSRLDAVRIKGIASEVAGQADILAVPDLESGNMVAKQLEYLAGASGSGLVLGARVPIALTSRADGPMARVASTVLAVLAAHDNRRKNAGQRLEARLRSTAMAILAVNAGSSSLKFSLHPYEGGQVLPHTVSGNFEGLEPAGSPFWDGSIKVKNTKKPLWFLPMVLHFK